MNLVVVHYLTLSFDQEKYLDFIEDMTTSNWSSGITCKIWKNTKTEFWPSNVLGETKFSKKLMGLTLAKRKDP